jgi:hypothetical protein
MHLYLDTIVLLESISHLPWYLSLTKCQSSSCQHMYSPITLVIHISFLPHPRSLPMYYYHKQFSDYIHFMGMPLPTSGSPIILPQLTVWFLFVCLCAFGSGWKCLNFDSESRSCCTTFFILNLSKFSLIFRFPPCFATLYNMGSSVFCDWIGSTDRSGAKCLIWN